MMRLMKMITTEMRKTTRIARASFIKATDIRDMISLILTLILAKMGKCLTPKPLSLMTEVFRKDIPTIIICNITSISQNRTVRETINVGKRSIRTLTITINDSSNQLDVYLKATKLTTLCLMRLYLLNGQQPTHMISNNHNRGNMSFIKNIINNKRRKARTRIRITLLHQVSYPLSQAKNLSEVKKYTSTNSQGRKNNEKQ
mmetsp:Transcript_27231/g.55563  ORF Transcript_27231/g.55563 Transcript_27231/m.55563 type:complete len:201 (+) Transcript_27231:1661-2263(+)